MTRIIRDRHLTKEEADHYNLIREQVKQDLPDLIAQHHARMREMEPYEARLCLGNTIVLSLFFPQSPSRADVERVFVKQCPLGPYHPLDTRWMLYGSISQGCYTIHHHPTPTNQCDGCQRGLPVNDQGVHVGDGGPDMMMCTKARYGPGPDECQCRVPMFRDKKGSHHEPACPMNCGLHLGMDEQQQLDTAIDQMDTGESQ